jgi:hypothetical protein
MKYGTTISTPSALKRTIDFSILGDFEEVDNYVIESKNVWVTPQLAESWMTRNFKNNRKLCTTRWRKYAKIMQNGDWKVATAISFDMEGVMINGQHRLKALIATGLTLPFVVTMGYEFNASEAFDRGANRNVANIAQLAGVDWCRDHHVSLFNALFYCHSDSHKLSTTFTDNEKINGILALEDSYDTCFYKYGASKGVKCGALYAVIAKAYFCERVTNKELLKDFLALLYGFNYIDDKNLFSQHKLNSTVITMLRAKMLSNDWTTGLEGTRLANEKSFYIQKALDLFLSGQKVGRTSKMELFSKDDLFPVPWIDDLSFNKPN